MRELKGVSDQETSDCVSVIRPMVFRLAQSIHHDDASSLKIIQ